MSGKIALVDDDQNILTSVSMALESEGYFVTVFHDGHQALKKFKTQLPDLIVLDVKMPRMDGIEMLTKLRQFSNIPVIFLTSKNDEIDELLGLRTGADDYISKPFSNRVLIERIRTQLRRSSKKDSRIFNPVQQQGPLYLDMEHHICRWNNISITLTPIEFSILNHLVKNHDQVKSREQLRLVAYGDDINVDDRSIDTHIKRIRKKFKDIDPEFDKIETLYGMGYRYIGL